MHRRLALLTALGLVGAPATALAQEDCPPGGWFCEDAEDVEHETEGRDETYPSTPEPPTAVEVPAERGSGPPVVVYYPADKPPPIVVDKAENLPKPPKRRRKREWGFNVRLQGVLMGGGGDGDGLGPHPDAGMGGLGFSLRYRPVPAFVFDVGADFIGGTDYNGNERGESALSFNGIIFFNPKDKLQLYTLGGLAFSSARVNVAEESFVDLDDGTTVSEFVERQERYSYFGGQLGIGLEWRVGKRTALNLDLIGFVRGRTDEQARVEPEFVHPRTGRATNASGGGLFRGGITFYW